MKTRFSLLLISALLFSFSACTSDKCDEEGDCLWFTIDGEEIVSAGSNGAIINLLVPTFNGGGTNVDGTNANTLQIVYTGVELGKAQFNIAQQFKDIIITYYNADGSIYTSATEDGCVNVLTLDTDEIIFEADFEGTLRKAEPNALGEETINVSNGYKDCKKIIRSILSHSFAIK